MHFTVEPSTLTDATVGVPGDKSISHRALLLGSIANGCTRVSGFLPGEDCLSTLAAMSALGVKIETVNETEITIHGVGLHGLRESATPLDLGNSGTAMRLLTGVLSGQTFASVLTGDASLTARPMQRVITPLTRMGAAISSDGGRPPLHITGHRPLRAIDYALPIASAQVKSAVLLAGLYADGATRVKEPAVTRDHTERMLETMGARISRSAGGVEIAGGQRLAGRDIRVPSDLSSAAFLILAALLGADTEICIVDVGFNPTRTGVIEILKSMGGNITLENPRWFGREPVADIRVRASELHGGAIDPALVSLAIDEFPVLFIAAAAASGRTTFSGIGELRVKESDRIAVMAAGLRALGVDVDESSDGAVIRGGRIGGGEIDSHGDHRVAMSFAVAGTVASSPVTIRDVAAVDTSFPGFCAAMRNLGVNIRCSGKSP